MQSCSLAQVSLSVPPHIEASGALDAPIAHEWDEHNPTFLGWDDRIAVKFAPMTERAMLALAIGYAEWITFRLAIPEDAREPFDFLEAMWVATVDFRYLELPRATTAAWRSVLYNPIEHCRGPSRGPLCATQHLLSATVDLIDRDQPAGPVVACLYKLATQVIPNVRALQRWSKAIVARFTETYSAGPSDVLGMPVSRPTLELDSTPEHDHERWYSNFFASLAPARNKFLVSPEKLRGSGIDYTSPELTQGTRWRLHRDE